jgi:hypothetical protein
MLLFLVIVALSSALYAYFTHSEVGKCFGLAITFVILFYGIFLA